MSTRNYKLGSSYDDDINLVENFIKFKDGNEEAEKILYHRYLSDIMSYWESFKDKLYSDEPFPKAGKFLYKENVLWDTVKNLRDNIGYYESIYYKYLNAIMDSGMLDMYSVYEIFYFISKIKCYEIPSPLSDDVLREHIKNNEFMLLSNKIGIYAINTYLFALINGISIIGIPDQFQYADGLIMCPYDFLDHDFAHDVGVKALMGSENMELLTEIYYWLHESDFNTKTKELILSVVWYNLHENGAFPYTKNKSDQEGQITNYLSRTIYLIQNDFDDEFLRLQSVIVDNIDYIDKIYEKFDWILYDRRQSPGSNLVSEIIDNIQIPDDEKKEGLRVLCPMFVFFYIYTNYFGYQI